MKLAGLLYTPDGISGKAPGMVEIHPGGAVKEQLQAFIQKHCQRKATLPYATTLRIKEPESRWHSEKICKVLDGKNTGLKKNMVPNGSHLNFYDNDKYIDPAIKDITKFHKPIAA